MSAAESHRFAGFLVDSEVGRADRSGPVQVVEYTDPFCPWAWGTEPKLRCLRRVLGDGIRWRRVLGILHDGRADEDPDGEHEAATQQRRLQEVGGETGAPFPARLEHPVSSSWIASRAVKAAQRQSPEVADVVLRRLRE